MISHAGRNDTRIFKECVKLGKELEQIGDAFVGGRTKAEVGILFDWENWWALELASGPSKDMDYLNTVSTYYKAFYEKNIPIDILSVEADLSSYKVIVAPMLYMIKEGIAEKIEEFVEKGGILLATTMTGLADENDRCIFGEYPGPLKEVLGIWIEETDALYAEEENSIIITDNTLGLKEKYSCHFLCDLLHTVTAKPIGIYDENFYKGMSVLTKNAYGNGNAYYIGTEPDDVFLSDFTGKICEEAGIKPLYKAFKNVEVTCRKSPKAEVVFVINHNEEEAEIDFGQEVLTSFFTGDTLTGKQIIGARDVFVLKRA